MKANGPTEPVGIASHVMPVDENEPHRDLSDLIGSFMEDSQEEQKETMQLLRLSLGMPLPPMVAGSQLTIPSLAEIHASKAPPKA